MFSFFKKKEAQPKVTDVVFARKAGKWHALAEVARQNQQIVLVSWFNDSLEELQQYFQQQNVTAELINYRQIHSGMIGNKQVIFIEHHPLKVKEEQAFASLNGNTISVYSSLDEPFFRHFGGDKITSLLDKLGMEENEAISHSLITKSIANAQEKLAEKVTIEQSADSMQEWMQKNVGLAF
jgi:preprotein translocase subunit SecA